MQQEKMLSYLRNAYQRGDLTLYLGAGVSLESKIPLWEELVTRMYCAALMDERHSGLLPYPNYLYAIAEWHLQKRPEPLEVTARRIRLHFGNRSQDFMSCLHDTLYRSFSTDESGNTTEYNTERLLRSNATLGAIANLCKHSSLYETEEAKGIRAVVTYNYDDLVEAALRSFPTQSLWQGSLDRKTGCMPVYHVHGYVPMQGQGSKAEDLIFTEEQYHQATHDPYSWSNLVQMKYMTGSTGLMVGMSLSDRNIRRLFEAIRKGKLRSWNYALLQRPQWNEPNDFEVDEIHFMAGVHYKEFMQSGIKLQSQRFEQIRNIVQHVQKQDEAQYSQVLEELGIHPVWYDDHREIPHILNSITDTTATYVPQPAPPLSTPAKKDNRAEIRDFIRELVADNSSLSIDYATNSKQWIGFSPNSWRTVVPKGAPDWSKVEPLLLFWFEISLKGISLHLQIQPGPQEERKRIYHIATANKPLLQPLRPLGEYYNRIYSQIVVDEATMLTTDITDLEQKVKSWWQQFFFIDFPNIERAILEGLRTTE